MQFESRRSSNAYNQLSCLCVDITELNLHKTTTIAFPNGNADLMNFEVTIRPDEGYYFGGTFVFTCQVSPIYPHEAPKVKCKTKVYHPNIDVEGNFCLNSLREYLKPVLNSTPSFMACFIFSRNPIMRIPSIMMQPQLRGITPRC